MTRSRALTLAGLTLWPLAYMVFFLGVIGWFITLDVTGHGGHGKQQVPLLIKLILPLHVLTMLDILALLVFYIRHLFRTELVAANMKAFWAVLLLLGNILAMPVYWYMYIWEPGEWHKRG